MPRTIMKSEEPRLEERVEKTENKSGLEEAMRVIEDLLKYAKDEESAELVEKLAAKHLGDVQLDDKVKMMIRILAKAQGLCR